MKVNVRLFASFREAAGRSMVEMDVPEGSTLAQILEIFVGMFPRAQGLASSTVFALNQEYVSADRVVKEGEEIVFIPPVSGGTDD